MADLIIQEKRILIGSHDKTYSRIYRDISLALGYQVDEAEPGNIAEKARTNDYSDVVMDANYGFPGDSSAEPSRIIYNILKPKIDAKHTKFIAVSGRDECLRDAEDVKKGIVPAQLKTTFNLLNFLRK